MTVRLLSTNAIQKNWFRIYYIQRNLNVGQEVMITILDTKSTSEKKVDLKKYMGKGEKLFQTDAQDYIKEMRSDERI